MGDSEDAAAGKTEGARADRQADHPVFTAVDTLAKASRELVHGRSSVRIQPPPVVVKQFRPVRTMRATYGVVFQTSATMAAPPAQGGGECAPEGGTLVLVVVLRCGASARARERHVEASKGLDEVPWAPTTSRS